MTPEQQVKAIILRLTIIAACLAVIALGVIFAAALMLWVLHPVA